jgi:hypothetical protein
MVQCMSPNQKIRNNPFPPATNHPIPILNRPRIPHQFLTALWMIP